MVEIQSVAMARHDPRWQLSSSSQNHPQKVLGELVSEKQMQRIQEALAPLTYAVPARGAAVAAMTQGRRQGQGGSQWRRCQGDHTDASGKTTQMEMGTAKVSEADIGLPFYPGTQPRAGEATKVSSPDGTMVTVLLHSEDAPDKVAGFYRDKLKAQAQGKQFTETSGDGSHMLMLADDKNKQIRQVMVAKGETKGSDIQISASSGAAK